MLAGVVGLAAAMRRPMRGVPAAAAVAVAGDDGGNHALKDASERFGGVSAS